MKERLGIKLENLDLTPEGREKAVVRLWNRGVETPDCIGYHCTTLEAIQYLITHGGIPGATDRNHRNPALPQKGDIYFLPRMSTFPFERLPALLGKGRIKKGEEEFALYEMETLPDMNAVAHRFCSLLGLNIARFGLIAIGYVDDFGKAKKSVDYYVAEKKLQRLGLDNKDFAVAVEKARKRKGIIIGLSRQALDRYPFSEGDQGNDFRLSTSKTGLVSSALSGIKPLGEEELIFCRNLKAKHKL